MAKLPISTIASQTPQNLTAAKQFLHMLDPTARDFLFVVIHPDNHSTPQVTRQPCTDNVLNSLVHWNNQGWNIFVTVNATLGTSRTKEDISEIRAIFIDDDGESTVKDYPLEPSLTVETSPGKKQVYWFLTGDIPVEEWNGVQQTLVNDYGCDPKARDVARVLRVPGFYNTKPDYAIPPLATLKNWSNGKSRYDWATIRTYFPLSTVVSSTGKVQGEQINLAATLEQAATGTNYHDAILSLVGWFYNTGVTSRDKLINLLQAQIDVYGDPNDPRFNHRRNQDIPTSVDWVLKKRKQEEAPIVMEDLFVQPTGLGGEYTVLPDPGGNMLMVVQWIESIMRYPNRTVAIIVAEHLVSVFGGGKYHIQGNTTTRKRTMLGQLGLGKNTITKALGSIVDALQKIGPDNIPHVIGVQNYIGSDSFSFSIQHKQIEEHRVRSFLVNEAGESGSSKAGDISNLRAYQLQALSTKADETLFPKKFSEQSKQDDSKQMNPVHGGVWVYLHESTIESYTALLQQNNAFANGDISRTDIFFVNPHIDLARINRGVQEVPPHIVGFFSALTRGLVNPEGKCTGNDFQHWEEIDISFVEDELYKLEAQIISDRNKASLKKDTIQTAMLARKMEKIMNTLLVYSTADAVSVEDGRYELNRPVVKLCHLEYALKRADLIEQTVIYHSRSGALTDAMVEAREKFIHYLSKVTKLTDDREIERVIPISDGGGVNPACYRVTRRWVQNKVSGYLANAKKDIYGNDPKRALDAFLLENTGTGSISIFEPVLKKVSESEWKLVHNRYYLSRNFVDPKKIPLVKAIRRK